MIELERGNDESREIPYARYSTVFNAAQCDGIEYSPIITTDEPEYEHDRIERIESMIDAFHDKPVISHEVPDRAYYSPVIDKINVPALSEFRQRESYYVTLFHELVHSTGHKSRLARKSMVETHGFGTHTYSKEELVAELGACFLASDAGIFSETIDQSASYIQGWLKALKENPQWLIQSANAAQRAVDYLKGSKPEDQSETAPD
jgi:antirestriction protein ArdC